MLVLTNIWTSSFPRPCQIRIRPSDVANGPASRLLIPLTSSSRCLFAMYSVRSTRACSAQYCMACHWLLPLKKRKEKSRQCNQSTAVLNHQTSLVKDNLRRMHNTSPFGGVG